MEWRHPHVLWALALVVVFAFVMLRLLAGRRIALLRFAEAGLIDRLLEGFDSRKRRVRLALRCAALAALVAALAGPRWGFRWEEVRREGIDLLVALDTSRSMLASDVAPNRLERAKLAVMDLIGRLDGDRVGLVAFSGTAFLECPLTLDYAAFERTLRALHAGIIPRGGTSLAQAIDTALESFDARQGKYQALVLITDGEDHEGNVEEAAERAAQAGVKIFTVGIGTPEGELLPADEASGFFKDRKGNVVKSRLEEESLTVIAQTSGGAYVRGLGPSLGLDEVFRDHISAMERRDVGSRLERRGENRFQFPLAIAIVLLIVEALVPDRRTSSVLRRRRTLPGRRAAAGAVVFGILAASAGPARAAGDVGVEGYRLYEEGQYGNAAQHWRQGLIDEPDSPILRYNLGAALFREEKFAEAAEAFGRVAASADPQWKGKAAYNWAGALYRVGQKVETSEPAATVKSWEQALEAYRLAMAADPADMDAKIGYEFVARRLEALRDKLEKENQEQGDEQQQGQPSPQDQPQDSAGNPQGDEPQQQEPGEQEAGEQQAAEQEPGEQAPDDQEAGEQQDPRAQRPQANPDSQNRDVAEGEQGEETPPPAESPNDDASEPSAGTEDQLPAPPGEQHKEHVQSQAAENPEAEAAHRSGEGSPSPAEAAEEGSDAARALAGDDQRATDQRAARAVLDAVRREELGPDDVDRTIGAAIVTEPGEDW